MKVAKFLATDHFGLTIWKIDSPDELLVKWNKSPFRVCSGQALEFYLRIPKRQIGESNLFSYNLKKKCKISVPALALVSHQYAIND